MRYKGGWDLSTFTRMVNMFNKNMSGPSVTALTIKHILYKHNLIYYEEYLRRNQTSENDYEVYVRFVLKDRCSGLEVLEVNSDYPLSEEEHLSHIRSYIRNKKIDEILGGTE